MACTSGIARRGVLPSVLSRACSAFFAEWPLAGGSKFCQSSQSVKCRNSDEKVESSELQAQSQPQHQFPSRCPPLTGTRRVATRNLSYTVAYPLDRFHESQGLHNKQTLSLLSPSPGNQIRSSRLFHSSTDFHYSAQGQADVGSDQDEEAAEDEDDNELAQACGLSVAEVVSRVKGLEGSAEKVAAEVPNLSSLLRDTRRGRLKKIGLPCKQRKGLLRALEKWRQGVWDPAQGVLT